MASSTLLVFAVVLLLQEPIRHSALDLLRFPFALLSRALHVLISLPAAPALLDEREHLRSELRAQQLTLTTLRESLRQARQTEILTDANPSSGGVVAQVIDKSRIPTQRTILIDKGERHGIVLHSVVLDVDGVVGRVAELSPATAVVILLTDPDSRIAGMVERSRETGLLVGRSVGGCDLIYLDDDADVVVGDKVVTAGLGGTFAKGLMLGKVQRIVRDVQRGSAWARVKLAANLGRLENVLCVPPSN